MPTVPLLAVGLVAEGRLEGNTLGAATGESTGRPDGDFEGHLEGWLVGSRDGFLKLPLPDLPDFELSIWHLLDLLPVVVLLPGLEELPSFDL